MLTSWRLYAGEPERTPNVYVNCSTLAIANYRKRVAFASAATIADFRFGKVLLRYMEELGLVVLGTEGVARVVHGGDSRMWMKTWQRIDNAVIDRRVLGEGEVRKMRQANLYGDASLR